MYKKFEDIDMSLRVENSRISGYSFNLSMRSTDKTEASIFNDEPQVSQEKRVKTARARYEAIQNKTLVYHPETTEKTYILWIFRGGDRIKPAYYEYTANGKESIYQIKQRFGIKDNALEKFNPYYKESESTDACFPTAGTKLRFYAFDVE